MKVLVKKSYRFVETLWAMYIDHNKVCICTRVDIIRVHNCVCSEADDEGDGNEGDDNEGDDDDDNEMEDGLMVPLDSSDESCDDGNDCEDDV